MPKEEVREVTDDERLENAVRGAVSLLEEAWTLLRARMAARVAADFRVPTLSSSLANPRAHAVEIALTNTRFGIQDAADREAWGAIARSAHATELIDDAALARVLKAFTS